MELSSLRPEDHRNKEPSMLYLPPGTYIRCAKGRSRAKAVQDLGRLGRWWTVELFAELNRETFDTITESYVNEGKFSDGHVCAKIVQHRSDDLTAERRWWARLSKSKAEILKGILKHASLAPPTLKVILSMPGIREGMEIGTWHKIIAAKCDEEIVRYLDFIAEMWTYLMGPKEGLQYVDPETVREFQSRVPGVSRRDYAHLAAVVMSGEAFKGMSDPSEREKLIDGMKGIKYLIPSIRTLQQDFKYLRPCTDTLKRLIYGTNKLPFTAQTLAYDAFSYKSPLGPDSIFMEKMKRLHLYIMRDMVELTGQSPLLEDGQDAPENCHGHQRSWYQLARRAHNLGLHSAEITRLLSENPDHQVALRALHDARPPSEYDYDELQLQNLLSSIAREFSKAREKPHQGHVASFTTIGAGEPIGRRCGRQYSGAYARDRWLFKLSEFSRPTAESSSVTSLFVRKSVFHAFWRLDEAEDDSMSDASPSETPSRTFPDSIVQNQPTQRNRNLAQQESPAQEELLKPNSTDRPQERWHEQPDELMDDVGHYSTIPQELTMGQPVEGQLQQLQQNTIQQPVSHTEPATNEGAIESIQLGPGLELVRPMAGQAPMRISLWNQSEWQNMGSYNRELVEEEIEKLEQRYGELLLLHPECGRVLCKRDIEDLNEEVICVAKKDDNIPSHVYPAYDL
ncbi:hypothetical protein QQZ08_009502 [Neonectria magnoliae]|uniref:Uncharacterized protein n=2 Tax=Neonectria TaxID=140106 RepID=A0ABR1HNL8_9HYPO